MNKLLTMISAVALLTAIAGSAYADQHEKTVFMTSAKFKSNLGGLAGADDKCQAEADDAASIVPSGIYLAWLPPASPGNHRSDGNQAGHALTFKLGHSMGADHRCPTR